MNARIITWHKPRKPTTKEAKAMILKDGMEPYSYVMERGEDVGVHTHNHDETRIILEGLVEFGVEGRMHVLKPGDRIDIKKGTPHTAKNVERGQSVMICGSKHAPL